MREHTQTLIGLCIQTAIKLDALDICTYWNNILHVLGIEAIYGRVTVFVLQSPLTLNVLP